VEEQRREQERAEARQRELERIAMAQRRHTTFRKPGAKTPDSLDPLSPYTSIKIIDTAKHPQ
jgi:hypothetical protein